MSSKLQRTVHILVLINKTTHNIIPKFAELKGQFLNMETNIPVKHHLKENETNSLNRSKKLAGK